MVKDPMKSEYSLPLLIHSMPPQKAKVRLFSNACSAQNWDYVMLTMLGCLGLNQSAWTVKRIALPGAKALVSFRRQSLQKSREEPAWD